MIGSNHQQKFELHLGHVDVWRRQNPNIVGTTWSNGKSNAHKQVQTRKDQVLVDERILPRITDIEIMHTKVSDYDAVMWAIETKVNKRKKTYNKILVDMMAEPEHSKKVKELFLKEKDHRIEAYERFKLRCVQEATKVRKSTQRKKKKNKISLLK